MIQLLNYKNDLKDLNQNIHLVPYIEDMPSLISSCDLIVSRAGATTLAEITALGAPSLIIPSPYVVANHQEYNAKELVDLGAAKWILEKDLTAKKFVEEVRLLMKNNELRLSLRNKAKVLGKPNACEEIYKEMLKTLERK
jgi:UDP-N-acetylglucosamine--N-acetylmuramyl-(pentapeptide) pyrophosphoryl-undecaprenol N-acetylglucosamine transferase